MGIEDILMHDESLFQNINAFDPDYVPPNYNYRDRQMEAMAMAIRPAISGGQPSNSVVLGSCATGKTTAIRKVFELVEKTTEKVVCVYINCQLHTTRFGIFSQIYKKLFGHIPPETGVPFSRIYDQIMHKLQSDKKALIVALDDVNYLFQSKAANKVFYDLLRAYEEYPGVKTGIFAILSDLEFRYAFDKNVNTVFIPQDITFQPYTYSEIEDILRDRVNAGFFPGVMGDEILELVAMHTYDVGDLTNEEQPVAIEERNEGPDEGDMTFTEQITDDGLRVVNPTGNVPYPQPPSDEEQSQQPQSHTVTSEELNEKNDEILEHIDPVPQCSYLSDEFMQNLNNKHNTRKIEKKNARDKL